MNLVKERRERNGWSQDHLADVSGVGKRTVQRVESGEVLPTPETAMALAGHLDLRPDEILNWSGLRNHLRNRVASWQKRPPTAEELLTVPEHLRPLFRAYYDGMASMKSQGDEIARINQEFRRLHDQTTSILDQNSADLQALRIAADPAAALEVVNRVIARRSAWEDTQVQQDRLLEQLRQTSEDMMRGERETAQVASRLDRQLDAYDVFSVYTPPSSTLGRGR